MNKAARLISVSMPSNCFASHVFDLICEPEYLRPPSNACRFTNLDVFICIQNEFNYFSIDPKGHEEEKREWKKEKKIAVCKRSLETNNDACAAHVNVGKKNVIRMHGNH